MANLKITQVPQGSSVGTTDDIYIKTGSNFRRVPVSKLIELMNAQGFFQKGLNGIQTTDLYVETVIISPDDDSFVSSKTYSQISAAEESGAEIQCEFQPDDGAYLRGMVLDITDSEALLAFLVPGPGPHISIFAVADLTVTETRIPISGQPCRAVCNTEEETTAKVATVQGGASGLFSLYDGATVYVYFTYAAVPGSTLNINSTGAKLIDFCGSTGIPAESFAQFFYHEALGKWILLGGGGGGSGSGLTDDIKTALLNIAAHVAWADADGQDYYDALESALYPETHLTSITASYDQDHPIYSTDSLETVITTINYDLTVVANYSDGTTETLSSSDYTISGTVEAGASVPFTISYEGKTATINVLILDGGALPTGYTKKDYIALDYTTGANIGNNNYPAIHVPSISLSSDYEYEIKVKYLSGGTSTTYASAFLGARAGQTGDKLLGLFVTPSTSKLGYWYDTTDTATEITSLVADSVNTIKIKPVGASATYPNNVVIEVNGTEYNSGSTSTGTVICTYLGFFRYAISNSACNATATYYHGFQIGELIAKNNGARVYDFVPAYDGADYGFYEKVGGTFYKSSIASTKVIGGDWS